MDPTSGAFVIANNNGTEIQKRSRPEGDNDSPPAKKIKTDTGEISIQSLGEKKKELEQRLKEINEQLAIINRTIDQASAAKEQAFVAQEELKKKETPKPKPKPVRKKTTTPKKKPPPRKKSSGSVTRPKRERKKSTVLREAEEASVPLPPSLESCKSVITAVENHRFGFPFLEPVDPVKLNIPDYFDVIKNPMDFGTIKKKLYTGKYKELSDFIDDGLLVFSNACLYNHPGTDVYIMSETLRDFFKKKMKPIEDRARRSKSKDRGGINELKKSVTSIQAELNQLRETASPPVDLSLVPMTKSEMRKLSATINSLSYKHLNTIIKIIQESMPDLAGEGELEIDLNSLDNSTLRKLETFVASVRKKKSRRKSSNLSIESQRELARRSQEGTAKEIETVQREIEKLRDPNFPARPATPTTNATTPPVTNTTATTAPSPVMPVTPKSAEEETVHVEDSSSGSESSSGSGSDSGSSSDSESDTESEADEK